MKKFYTVIILLTLCIAKNNNLKAQVNVNDSLALVDLYNSTDGANWINHTNWLTVKPVKTWYGINLNNKKVIVINLNSNNLNGSLPSSIGDLTNLSYVSLSNNQLSGNIPSELSNTNISNLILSHNQLTGSIPAVLGNAGLFTAFDLSYNQLTGSIPAEFDKYHNIRSIDLSHNQLTGQIPVQLKKLLYILFLSLDYNQLTGQIPPQLGDLYYLNRLSLNNNNLNGHIPSELGSLSQLEYLSLNDNQLSGIIPSDLANSSHITYLNLSDNQLRGNIPSAIGNGLVHLRYLSLSHNDLKGEIPSTFTYLNNLRELDVRDNKLSGTVPAFLADLPYLQKLNIRHNNFTFDGIEELSQHNFKTLNYDNERQIHINNINSTLSVYAGGTLSNNTYKWYKDGALVSTITGDSTFTPSTSGAYNVEVTNAVAKKLTLYSDTITFSTLIANQQTNISSLQVMDKNNFSVYPNPAKTTANIYFSNEGNYTIQLANAAGNILETKTVNAHKRENIQVDVSHYSSGLYFIFITDANKHIQTLKLNKQ